MNQVSGSFLNQLSSSSLGASMNSGPLRVRDFVGISLFLQWTGATVAGNFKIQASNDLSNNPTNWNDIPSITYAASGPGNVIFNLADMYYGWLRVVYTRTSGTGTITDAVFQMKGYN